MPVTDWKIDCLAQAMIAKHGVNAARASVERLNDRIERRDWTGRDVWARVVHAIHDEQGDLDAAVLIELNRPVPTPRYGPTVPRREREVAGRNPQLARAEVGTAPCGFDDLANAPGI